MRFGITLGGVKPRAGGVCEPLESRRLLSAGDLDLTFSGDGKATATVAGNALRANNVAVQSDGKVIVVGESLSGWLSDRFVIARFDTSGNLDLSFGESGTGLAHPSFVEFASARVSARAVAIQPDNRIVVAGSAGADALVARFTADGVLDTTFSGDGRDVIGDIDGSNRLVLPHGIALQNDGKIVIAATSLEFESDSDMAVVRYTASGTRDASFDGNGVRNIGFGESEGALAVTIDYSGTSATNPHYGKLILVGDQTTSGDANAPIFAVARLNTNGTLDNSFDGDGKRTLPFRPEYAYSSARGVAVQAGGKIVIAGEVGFSTDSATHNFGLIRLNADGSSDFSFGQEVGKTEIDFGGYDFVSELITGQTGRLIVGGSNADRMALACFSAEGVLDTVFSGDGKQTVSFQTRATVRGLAPAPGGTFVAAGGENFATARLFDRRAVTVSIGSFQPNGSESGPTATGFIVARLEPQPSPTRVFINIGGIARSPSLLNSDYTVSSEFTINHPLQGPSYVDIPANQAFIGVTVTPIDDTRVEGDETAIFSIAESAAYDIGTPPNTTLAIRDNDTVGGPVVVSTTFLYETAPQRARFTFNQNVESSIGSDDFVVSGPSGAVPFSFAYDDIANTATLSFTSGPLADGNYAARAVATDITNGFGTPMASDAVLSFFALAGDADRDRTVGPADFNLLATNFGKSGQTFSAGDFDYDTVVGPGDFNLLATNFGKTLAPPPAPLVTPTASAAAAAAPGKAAAKLSNVPRPPSSIVRATPRLRCLLRLPE